jgi:alkylresorcinol/alkylpyrone synthase
MVAVETCSISIRLDSDDPGGDRRNGPVRRRCGGRRGDERRAQPGANHRRGREAMAGHAADHGLGHRGSGLAVVFDRAIPPFIEGELAGAVGEMLGSLASSAKISIVSAAIRAE